MGNCMETCVERKQIHEEKKEEENNINSGVVKETSVLRSEKGGSLRVKIVVTKEELQWLMIQLSNNKEGKSLDEFLGEIERGREQKVVVGQYSWKPSLESIMECPEVAQEMDR